MAITRPLLATSLLLFSLLVIASANDYSYDSSKNQAYVYGTKPEGEAKPDYDTKPTPKAEEKHEYGTKPDLYKPQPEVKEKAETVETEKRDYGTRQVYQPNSEKPDYDAKKNLYKPQPEEKEKPESKEEEKPDYGTKPDLYKSQPEEKKYPEPVETENPDYSTKLVYQPQPEKEEKPDYGTEKNYKQQPEEKEKPESEEEEKPDYGTKPDSYTPQPEETKKTELSEEVEKPNYSTKPDFYNSKSEEKEKPNYDKNPYVAKTNPEEDKKPDHYVKELPDFYPPKPEVLPIGVQGLVLCKSGSHGYYPIEGALARITCLSVDENGYEKPYSVYSGKTDAKGYFFATLSPLGLYDQLTKLRDCKAFLESSPVGNCNVPVDVNKGITGAPLSDFRVLDQKRMKLYSVGPFFFCSEPNSVPNGY
ncbi:hypothetical protein DITRI_Ditri11bG0111800 [Diplodiscus trichospermus]